MNDSSRDLNEKMLPTKSKDMATVPECSDCNIKSINSIYIPTFCDVVDDAKS